jgi:hypothetical protein
MMPANRFEPEDESGPAHQILREFARFSGEVPLLHDEIEGNLTEYAKKPRK